MSISLAISNIGYFLFVSSCHSLPLLLLLLLSSADPASASRLSAASARALAWLQTSRRLFIESITEQSFVLMLMMLMMITINTFHYFNTHLSAPPASRTLAAAASEARIDSKHCCWAWTSSQLAKGKPRVRQVSLWFCLMKLGASLKEYLLCLSCLTLLNDWPEVWICFGFGICFLLPLLRSKNDATFILTTRVRHRSHT